MKWWGKQGTLQSNLLPLTCCVILGKSVHFSEPQCLFQLNGCIGRFPLLLFQL